MPFDEFEEDIEPLLGDEFSVKLVVSRISIFKVAKHLGDAFHHDNSTTTTRDRSRREASWFKFHGWRGMSNGSDCQHSPNNYNKSTLRLSREQANDKCGPAV
jgi:hypothetical protein